MLVMFNGHSYKHISSAPKDGTHVLGITNPWVYRLILGIDSSESTDNKDGDETWWGTDIIRQGCWERVVTKDENNLGCWQHLVSKDENRVGWWFPMFWRPIT